MKSVFFLMVFVLYNFFGGVANVAACYGSGPCYNPSCSNRGSNNTFFGGSNPSYLNNGSSRSSSSSSYGSSSYGNSSSSSSSFTGVTNVTVKRTASTANK